MKRIAASCLALAALSGAQAAQVDIAGPTGSGRFGAAVAALPNGNVVVTDPDFSLPGIASFQYVLNGRGLTCA
jgi:hypothetical protein